MVPNFCVFLILGLPNVLSGCCCFHFCIPFLIRDDSDIFLGLRLCTLSWHGWHRGMVFLPPRDCGTTWWCTILFGDWHSKQLYIFFIVNVLVYRGYYCWVVCNSQCGIINLWNCVL